MRSRWFPYLILLVVSALAYLPFIGRFTYTNDDWYLMYGAQVQGSDYFVPAYASDRPMRAYVLGPAYDLFGNTPLPYHVSAYVFRFLGAVSLFWLLNQIWGKNKIPNLLATLLFLIYPGFLSQPNPIDYQSQIVSLFAAMTSLALTAAALKTGKPALRWTYTLLSILLSFVYLGLIEYYLGLEMLRFLTVYLVLNRRVQGPPRMKLWQTLKAWMPFAIGPLVFLVWRLFIFSSERKATDVGFQLDSLLSNPLQTGFWWLARFLQDTINVLFLAWGVPLYNLAFNLDFSDTWIGFGLAGAVALGVVFAWWKMEKSVAGEVPEDGWRTEMLWVGVISAMAGLVPVILVNRHVEFFSYSRYALASSAGAAMAIAALLHYLPSPQLRRGLAALLVGMALLTHHANAANKARGADAVRDFWWQVSWRVPQIQPGTTLAAQFPASIEEDYFLWGPANLIYYPEPQSNQPIETPIGAVLLTPENIARILTGKSVSEPDRRNITVTMDYGNMLILTQTSPESCVRVLDGFQPEFSTNDDPRILVVASTSKIENVVVDGSHADLPKSVFGDEPEHGWCWYYQQASLARQRGEWDKIVSLGEQAMEHGYYPVDAVEWMPFLQAYAVLGHVEDLKKLSSDPGGNLFLKEQACTMLMRMADMDLLTAEMENQALEWYCE